MNIKYLLLFSPNLAYHILAQINYSKEWGPASVFSEKYINELKKNDYRLLISDEQSKQLKNKLNKYFAFLTFNCLRPWYKSIDDLIKDLSDEEILIKKIKNDSDFSIKEVKSVLNIFFEAMRAKEKNYLKFWKKENKLFKKQINIFSRFNKKIIKDYFDYLKKEVNPSIEIPKNYFIFLIKSLNTKGRGLKGACATGIPENESEIKEYTRTVLHEITHYFSDPLLKKAGFTINIQPGNNDGHLRKEQFVEYILNNYLVKNYKTLSRKYTYSLITDELIKKALGEKS